MPSSMSRSIRYGGPSKAWAPVPWMLEAAILIQLGLGDYVEAGVVALLAAVQRGRWGSSRREGPGDAGCPQVRLALVASARRDGKWVALPAAQLVAGDIVKLSLGAVVVADVRITDGSILLDQSMLTGESVPVESGAGAVAYAGALVRRGEAVAEVTATGERTKFGRTAELVRTAAVESTQQKIVMRVVRNLALFNGGVTVLLAAYALWLPMRARRSCRSSWWRSSLRYLWRCVHVHACGIGRRPVARPPGRPADKPLGGRRSGRDRHSLRRQDGHPDAQMRWP